MSPQRKSSGNMMDIESPLAIELRRVMIRLNREMDLDRKRCLMITSSERGEGKSLFSYSFSLVLANHLQKRVLLVDGDLRRPVQHRAFQLPLAPGFAECLQGDEASPRRTALPNLDVLPAGAAGDEPSRLLGAGRVRAAMDTLQRDYDIVLLDSPPVVPVSDPLQYVDHADGIIYLVMAGRTSRDVVARGVAILRGVGANILGVVANNLSEVLPYYYDRKYYGYSRGRRER